MRNLPATLMLLHVLATPSQAQEKARDIVLKGIQARGGQAKLEQVHSMVCKIKGTYHTGIGAFTGELHCQFPDQFRFDCHFEQNGAKMTQIQLLNGERGWITNNGQTQAMDPATLDNIKSSIYSDYVLSLTPLVTDREFSLSKLEDMDVQGKPAAGVVVERQGQPRAKLYFDKATGLLVILEKEVTDRTRQKVIRKAVLSDYRELDWVKADEQALKIAKVSPEGPALLDFFRKQILTDADKKAIQDWIQQLGNDAFATREKASKELVSRGAAAVPFLRDAAKDADPEIAGRAQECIKAIDGGLSPAVVAAAARMVGHRKPAGAVEVLLNYLPFAADDAVATDVRWALAALALRDGKPDPILVKALEDKDPIRQQAAAGALGKDGGRYELLPGRRLLLNGLKNYHKISREENGKKELDWEILDIQFYNRLDDKVFAKP